MLFNEIPRSFPNYTQIYLLRGHTTTINELCCPNQKHHLKVLSENSLIIIDNKESYSTTYFLTSLMEKNYESFRDSGQNWEKVD